MNRPQRDNLDWRDEQSAAAPIYTDSNDHQDFLWWQGWTWDEAWRVAIFALPAL